MNKKSYIPSNQWPEASSTKDEPTSVDSFNRRSFIRRSGGATVAALVGWNLATSQANAQGNTVASYAVSGSSNDASKEYYRATYTLPGGNFNVQLTSTCSPAGPSPTPSKTLTITARTWMGVGAATSAAVTVGTASVTGSVDSDSVFTGSTTPTAPTTYKVFLANISLLGGDNANYYAVMEIINCAHDDHQAYVTCQVYFTKETTGLYGSSTQTTTKLNDIGQMDTQNIWAWKVPL